jgi:dihydroorotate dehydrogenase electron transfer subunit
VADRTGAPDTLDLLVKIVGPATRALAALPTGSQVKLLGPLGNGFTLPPRDVPVGLVAGGCGWASLELLARELRRRGHRTYAFIGAKSIEELPLRTAEGAPPRAFADQLPEVCVTSRELDQLGVIVALAAEQGGRVYGGLVTELLEKFLSGEHGRGAHLYACGPRAMLRRVAELAEDYGVPCQVVLEEIMGCGLGVCNSCVVEIRLPDGSVGHKRLCVDGPVLDADEVNWEQGG